MNYHVCIKVLVSTSLGIPQAALCLAVAVSGFIDGLLTDVANRLVVLLLQLLKAGIRRGQLLLESGLCVGQLLFQLGDALIGLCQLLLALRDALQVGHTLLQSPDGVFQSEADGLARDLPLLCQRRE